MWIVYFDGKINLIFQGICNSSFEIQFGLIGNINTITIAHYASNGPKEVSLNELWNRWIARGRNPLVCTGANPLRWFGGPRPRVYFNNKTTCRPLLRSTIVGGCVRSFFVRSFFFNSVCQNDFFPSAPHNDGRNVFATWCTGGENGATCNGRCKRRTKR